MLAICFLAFSGLRAVSGPLSTPIVTHEEDTTNASYRYYDHSGSGIFVGGGAGGMHPMDDSVLAYGKTS